MLHRVHICQNNRLASSWRNRSLLKWSHFSGISYAGCKFEGLKNGQKKNPFIFTSADDHDLSKRGSLHFIFSSRIAVDEAVRLIDS